MKKDSITAEIFNFIEVSISLFIFIFVFHFFIVFSFDVLEKQFSFIDYNKFLENQKVMATVVESRDDLFYKQIEDRDETKIAFVGDIMLDRGVQQKINQKGNGDFNFIFQSIREDLKKYDLLVGNLEGPVSDKGKDKHNLYSFRMEPVVLNVLKDVGFGAVSVANNHMGDWGEEAMKDTFDRLNDIDIKVLGGGENIENASAPKIIEIDGVKVSLLSFGQFGKGEYEATDEKAGIAIISENLLKKEIELARKESDIVIVSFHFGEEYQEIQNSYQEKYSKLAIDFGADLIVGHHPHIIQPLDQYKNVYIAYSLGNFVFDQYFSPETMEGGLLEVIIENKVISDINLKKIEINSNYQPHII